MFHFMDKETETEIEGTCQEVVGQSSPILTCTHPFPPTILSPTAVTYRREEEPRGSHRASVRGRGCWNWQHEICI